MNGHGTEIIGPHIATICDQIGKIVKLDGRRRTESEIGIRCVASGEERNHLPVSCALTGQPKDRSCKSSMSQRTVLKQLSWRLGLSRVIIGAEIEQNHVWNPRAPIPQI